jgi:hypothetical protein
MTVRVPPKRILRRALEVAAAKGFRVQVNSSGGVELVTPTGTVLDQIAINAAAREIELEQERETAA